MWWLNSNGYIEGRVWMPNGKARRVKQHRWILECHLGRILISSEDVHHINGDKRDNRIENLQLIPHGEHSTLSNTTRKRRKGYKLKLSKESRKRRSERAKEMGLGTLGRAANAKARGENGGAL